MPVADTLLAKDLLTVDAINRFENFIQAERTSEVTLALNILEEKGIDNNCFTALVSNASCVSN